jgi:hypothetical protein
MRTTGSAPVFQVPKRNKPSARVFVTILLCALVPPLGLIIVWRGLRCPVRGKVLLSAVALLSLTVMLTAYIGFQMNSGILIPEQAAGQFAVNDYTASSGSTVQSSAPTAQPTQTPAPAEPEMTPAPANPFG